MKHRSVAILLALSLFPLVLHAAETNELTGRVRDSSGNPVAGAEVAAFAMAMDPVSYTSLRELGRAPTGPDGAFEFRQDATDFIGFIVLARKQGMAIGWASREIIRPETPLEIVLGAPAGVAGIVVDEADNPVAGASVHVVAYPNLEVGGSTVIGLPPADWLVATSDFQGAFRFPNLPEGFTFDFYVRAEGKGVLSPGDMVVGQYSAGQKDVHLVLVPEGRIEGTLVRKSDQSPLGGLSIFPRRTSESLDFLQKSVITAPDGRFTIPGLVAGEYSLRISAGQDGSTEYVAESRQVAVEAGKSTSLGKLQAVQGGLLVVHVVDGNTSHGLSGAYVTISPQSEEPWWLNFGNIVQLRADAQGVAKGRVLPGRYQVRTCGAWGHEPLFDTAEDDGVSRKSLQVWEGQMAEETVKLSKPLVIKGRVLDAWGKPAAGVDVTIAGRGPFPGHAVSDQEGGFELKYYSRCFPSESKVVAIARNEKLGQAGARVVEIPCDSIEIQLRAVPVVLGKVTDPGGIPVANASVTASLDSSHGVAMLPGFAATRTDAHGLYQLKAVPTGDGYLLHAFADGYVGAGYGLPDAEAGAITVEADPIVLQRANFSISGVVHDAEGMAVQGAAVSGLKAGSLTRRFATTDKAGTFALQRLPEGQVHVRASLPGKRLQGEALVKAGTTDLVITLEEVNAPTSAPVRGEDSR